MKTKFKLVKLDTTYGWNEDFLRSLGITKIHTWYIFDSNETTNCCELLPSYELIPVYEAPENEWDMTEEQRNEYYESQDINAYDHTVYMHCNAVDPIATELPSEFDMDKEVDAFGEESSWLTGLEACAIFNQAYLHLL